jgi:molecular chaperone GrpE (heat shock protein)
MKHDRAIVGMLTRAIVAAAALCALTTVALAQTKPPVDPVQANKDVRAGTDAMEANVGAAMKNLQKLANKVADLKKQSADAKKKADAAANAAANVRLAANRCETTADKKKIEQQIKDAEQKLSDAQAAQDKADATEKSIRDGVKSTTDAIDGEVKRLNDLADAGLQQVKAQGIADNSVVAGNLKDAKAALTTKVDAMKSEGTQAKKYSDRGSIDKMNSEANKFNPEIRQAKQGNDTKDALDKAASDLKDAKDLLDDCPKKSSMVVPKTQDVYVAVDNRPQNLVCVADGQNVGQAVNQLGLADSAVVATASGSGTVVSTTTDAKTVDAAAKAKGVNLCFKTEGDYCTIMTPLTAFRGENFADGPNPPLDWGAAPPTTVIHLGRRR